jgi:hypothetical protein
MTDGYDPNADVPACPIIDEEDGQCQYNKDHFGLCSFDEQLDEVEHELVLTVLKERDPKGLPFEIIDGSGFLGLTAELEDDDER